jgi:hypothetical protein
MNRCRTLVPVLLAMMLCSSCTVWKQQPAKAFSQATGGEQLERLLWQEIEAGHWVDVENHVASNFIAVTRHGVQDRAAAIAYFKGLKLDDYTLGDFQTQLNGNTFVIVYTIELHGTLNGQVITRGPRRVLTVWQEQKAGWMMIAHSFIETEPTQP